MPGAILVELMGAPGAGKSTVDAALRATGARIVTPPTLTRRPYAWRLAPHVLATAAALARRRALGRQWSATLVAMAAYLRALPPVLERETAPGDVVLFDQGPLYTLMRPPLRDPRLADWWEASLERWRSLLDVVVWLDAPVDVLADRIEARAKEHRYKGADREAALAAITADRGGFQELLGRFDGGGPAVLRFDTSRQGAGEVAAAVLAAAESRRGQ